MNGKALAKVDQPSEASNASDKPVASKRAEAPKPAAPSKTPAVAAAPAAKMEEAAPEAPKGPVPVVGAATDAVKGKGRFTLQLSSFQDKSEAEAFAAKVGAEKTFITVSEIPGKGTWYRVRVGDFATQKEAMAGKLAFEKKHSVIAYVTQK
jgi:septal ring-binding cell division protein DamX